MNLRGCLVAAFAGVALASGAHATDAVVPDPYQAMDTGNVGACDAYGTGFVAIPGTTTCAKVSGQVRFEQGFSKTSRTTLGRTTLDFETRSD